MGVVRHSEELRIYQQAFDAAMTLFEISKGWPAEERYSLTDQVRRSSRSVCANIAEAWRKRRYPNHFVSKLSDADSEAAETENWIKFAASCGYITSDQQSELRSIYESIIRGLTAMISQSDQWCTPHVRETSSEYNINDIDLPAN